MDHMTYHRASGADPGIQLRGPYGQRFAQAYNGGLGVGSRGRAPGWVGQGVRGRSPTEAERHSLFRCPKEGEILPTVKDFSAVFEIGRTEQVFLLNRYPDF